MPTTAGLKMDKNAVHAQIAYDYMEQNGRTFDRLYQHLNIIECINSNLAKEPLNESTIPCSTQCNIYDGVAQNLDQQSQFWPAGTKHCAMVMLSLPLFMTVNHTINISFFPGFWMAIETVLAVGGVPSSKFCNLSRGFFVWEPLK